MTIAARKKEALQTAGKRGGRLRKGFSTGTAMTAAARAALRGLLTGETPKIVAVRLPVGFFLPILVDSYLMNHETAVARVIKDGGDDPDVTHKAAVRARVRIVSRKDVTEFLDDNLQGGPGTTSPDATSPFAGWVERSETQHLVNQQGPQSVSRRSAQPATAITAKPRIASSSFREASLAGRTDRPSHFPGAAFICLIGGEGVGVVTKPGLPVRIGEPAVNPAPRQMLAQNLSDELAQQGLENEAVEPGLPPWETPDRPCVFIPLESGSIPRWLILEVVVEVEKGAEIARHTLNPRLGIMGGISILGTTGIVKPFSHKAYEETIQTALSVAASNRCREVVLSTGGKSERFAREVLTGLAGEAFVQVADFFAFSVGEARRMGFASVVHSAFFGKVVKMAQGHAYTHAHEVTLDLNPVADLAREMGYDENLFRELASANTARHALDLLISRGAEDLIRAVARGALKESRRLAGEEMSVRLLLFDYNGALLADLEE